MCGIAGIYNLDGAPASISVLKRMIDIQRHRGPDDQGVRLFSLAQANSEEVPPDAVCETSFEGALGFNRLSILDLSQNGHQPMVNTAGNIIIAYNGEVYNAFDFREELEAAGYQFRSKTDTEVILYLYEHYGLEGVLSRIRGMFAFCIVDLRKGELLLARDHLGIKPLYYTIQKGSLLFASELKSFLVHPKFEARISEDDLDEVLCFRFCSRDRTPLHNVHQLRPGHSMRISREDATPRVTRYWEIPDCPRDGSSSFAANTEKTEALLRNSVERHLLSDVKLGCQLSGGIDSSLVTYFARSHFDANLESFSIDFQDPVFSESRWFSQAAAKANATSHKFVLDGVTMAGDLHNITWHAEGPVNLPPMFGLYHLGRNAAKSVTVLLSGEGSDELMGGYERFYWAAVRKRYAPLLRIMARIPIVNSRLFGRITMQQSSENAFVSSITALLPEAFAELRPDASFDQTMARRQALFAEGKGDFMANCQKYELQTYLVYLLNNQDKLMMAHSVENRVPFVDVDMVEAVRRFPVRHQVGSLVIPGRGTPYQTKKCLKNVANGIFGREFTYRPKMGFVSPTHRIYKTDVFRELYEDEIRPGLLKRGWYDPKALETCLQIPESLSDPSGFMSLVATEIWAQQFLDGKHWPVGAKG